MAEVENIAGTPAHFHQKLFGFTSNILRDSVAEERGVKVALDADFLWQELTRFIETMKVPSLPCVVDRAEVVAFDNGREYSGGTFSLNGSKATSHL